MSAMSSVYNDNRKRIEDLPDISLGGRPIKVADVFGQGLVVYDAERQSDVVTGRVRLWRLRSNTEADVLEANCNFERPDSLADQSRAVRGFADFLVNGPSPQEAHELGRKADSYVDDDEGSEDWAPDREPLPQDEPDPSQQQPVEYDEDPDDAHWK